MAGTSQSEWVLQIGELLRRDDLRTPLETPTSIFKLPDSVISGNPEAYSPSSVLLGPYHDFKPELHKMEIFKLENAKKAKARFQLPEFSQMVDELKELEVQIRACYDRNLEMGSEALAWRMLIDGLFLLRLLGISPDDEDDRGKDSGRRSKPLLPVFSEQQLYLNLERNIIITQNEIVKDMLKLANQIPVQVLKRVCPRNLSGNLALLFYKFCVSVSPLPLPPYDDDDFLETDRFSVLSEVLGQSQHLLHFLYALIFYESFLACGGGGEQRFGGVFLLELLNMMAKVIRVGVLQQLVEAVGLIQSLVGLLGRVRESSSAEDSSHIFPSASELKRVGVKFECSGFESVGFRKENTALILPIITINAFCEVIFRNLVAFESEAKLNPPYFSHYVTLMSGLIATAKDIRILKQAGIINSSHSGDDQDIVKLFNELRNLLKVAEHHQGEHDESTSNVYSFSTFELHTIEGINQYYESCWKIKAERFAKRHICPAFQALIILIIVLLIAIVAIRTVCGWFSCPKIFGPNISATTEILSGGYYFL